MSEITKGGYQLGCGSYEVYFKQRCGGDYVCRADRLLSLSYNRILNDTSVAKVTVGLRGTSEECCLCLGGLNPWEHEISIFRNGIEVWVGPIVEIEFDTANDKATFTARDLSTWLERRVVELRDGDYDVENIDSKDVFEYLMNHAYCKQPWCMTWSSGPTGVGVTKYYPSHDNTDRWGGTYPIVGDEIRSLAEFGVDYTVVNRHMYAGDLDLNPPTASKMVLLSSHWAIDPIVRVSGIDMTTRTIVAGGDGGWDGYYDEQVWIEPPVSGPISPGQLTANQKQYGLIETFQTASDLYDEDTTTSPNAVTQIAFGRHELDSVPFVYIDGGQLSKEAPLLMENLIPGAIIEVRMQETCRPFFGPHRLYELTVSVDNLDETIGVQVAPVGVDSIRNIG
jgi:hypothetical protein